MFTFSTLVNTVVATVNNLITVLIGAAVIIFMFGLVQFIYNSTNEQKIKQGRTFIMWGLVSLFLIFSIWGILNLGCSMFTGGCH